MAALVRWAPEAGRGQTGAASSRHGRKWIEKSASSALQPLQPHRKGAERGFPSGQTLNPAEPVSASANYADSLLLCCVFDADAYNQEIFCSRNVVIVKSKIN